MQKNSLTDAQHLVQQDFGYPTDYQLSQSESAYLLPLTGDEADSLQTALTLAMLRLEDEDDPDTMQTLNDLYWRVKYDGLLTSQ